MSLTARRGCIDLPRFASAWEAISAKILQNQYANLRRQARTGHPGTWWQDKGMTNERLEVQRTIAADPAAIFRLLCDPQGHVAIDSSGMLMAAAGEPVTAAGDSFVVHMDREALNDYPLGRYDVTVTIATYVPDREIAWTILGEIRPPIGHRYGYVLEPVEGGTLVTSYYDWSSIDPVWRTAGIFPVLSEGALRATLGILARTVTRGYPGSA
jgi:Polyketide cyclase / dehydrase and lipid transport